MSACMSDKMLDRTPESILDWMPDGGDHSKKSIHLLSEHSWLNLNCVRLSASHLTILTTERVELGTSSGQRCCQNNQPLCLLCQQSSPRTSLRPQRKRLNDMGYAATGGEGKLPHRRSQVGRSSTHVQPCRRSPGFEEQMIFEDIRVKFHVPLNSVKK